VLVAAVWKIFTSMIKVVVPADTQRRAFRLQVWGKLSRLLWVKVVKRATRHLNMEVVVQVVQAPQVDLVAVGTQAYSLART
jgi:hypothetical protein